MKTRLIAALVVCMSFLSSVTYGVDLLNGAGASFPNPLYQAWAKEYKRETKTKIKYDSIGSGGGIKAIKSRSVDFGASDAPMLPQDLMKEGLIQFPTVIGGVVPVVHLEGVGPGRLNLDSDVLTAIFMGSITQWNDERIVRLNPSVRLPGNPITVVHRSDESGTTAIFTDYLSKVNWDWKSKIGTGKAVSWPTGTGQKGNEGVAQYVKDTPGTIGYVEYAFAKQYELAYTKLKNANGYFVEPTVEGFQLAAAKGLFYPGLPVQRKEFYIWLTNEPGRQTWPITAATFIILAAEKKDVNEKVIRFIEWAYKKGDSKAEELMYFPLPDALKEKVALYWKEKGMRVQ
jgi:phosphate transport system substrate-binding protein